MFAGILRHVTAASVRAALAGRLRGNYFTMRLEDTRRLFETVPWVAQASVRRVWPDRLVVTLTEHRALGVWEDGRLLSDRGELFVANPDEAEVYGQLPEFSGPFSAAKDAARRYYELSAQFAPLSLRIGAIDISDRKAWSLRLVPDPARRRQSMRAKFALSSAVIVRRCRSASAWRRSLPRIHWSSRNSAVRRRESTRVTPTVWRHRLQPRRQQNPNAAGMARSHEKRKQRPDRRARHRHLEGRRRGGRSAARWSVPGDRPRSSRVARPAQGRGGQHRSDRAIDTPSARGSRVDGRVPDSRRVHRHRRQSHQELQLERHGGDQGPRSRCTRRCQE